MSPAITPSKRICLRCHGLVKPRRFDERHGVCHHCISEVGELDLRSDPWAFAVDFDRAAA